MGVWLSFLFDNVDKLLCIVFLYLLSYNIKDMK